MTDSFIKHFASYKCESIDEHDKFKIELRKIEAELKSETESNTRKCNAVINADKKESSEISEVKQLLEKRN
jgi:hypothetical protein